MKSDLIELSACEDCEGEENNKEEKDDKFHSNLVVSSIPFLKSTTNVLHAEIFLFIHHPEISTPPPQTILFLS